MAFGENLKKVREMQGVTTAELAESAGIAQPQIAKYESGMNVPNAITAVRIAERLGTTVEKLVNLYLRRRYNLLHLRLQWLRRCNHG